MNTYHGAPAKVFHGDKRKKPTGEEAYSQASTGAGLNPVDATTLGGPPFIGTGGPPGGNSSFTTTNIPDTRNRPEFHAGRGGATLQSQAFDAGSPLEQQALQEAAARARVGVNPMVTAPTVNQTTVNPMVDAPTVVDGNPMAGTAPMAVAIRGYGADTSGQPTGDPMPGRDPTAIATGDPMPGRDPTATATQTQQSIAATSQLSPLQQQHVEEREQAKPPEERVSVEEFMKSSDLVGNLSPSDQSEATRILKEQGQAAFSTFVASRSVASETALKVDAVTAQSINDAKTAFAQGGLEDFFKAHDQFQVLSDPNASEVAKASASSAIEHILANPNPDASPRIVKSDNLQTGNASLDKALSIVAAAGTSGTINEADMAGLDEETQSVVRTVASKIKQRADDAGQNFDDLKRRALQGELVGDLGFGMSGGIAVPPDNWSPVEKARHWLNQAMSYSKNGQLNRSWKDNILFAFRDADLSGDAAWERIESAFSKYTAEKNAVVSAATSNSSNDISIEEGMGEGGDSWAGFIEKKRRVLMAESEAEDVEIANNNKVLESLDTLLSGGQVSEQALASLPPEMTDRVRNIQVRSREHEIARRESALLQKFGDFEEGERQRIASDTERRRLQSTAPSLTLDVAGKFQPPGTLERVASVEDKIDRGGQLTGQDMIGLPADEQRRLQDLSTAAINNMTDVDAANAEIQLEARRRMLDPFTAAGGGSIYGQGNAHQTFGRNVMSGVEQRIAQTLNDITVSADRERAGRKDSINSQYDQAIHKLSRIFATSPDKLSGAAQRRFEELEAERSNALSGVDVEVDRSVRDEQRLNIELLTGLQESREAAALGAEELNLNALSQAAGFAGGLDDRALREAEVYGRGTLSGEIQRGQLGLGERETALREAEMFGGTEGVNLGQLTTLDVPFVIGQDGQLAPGVSMDEFYRAQSDIEKGFRDRFGRDASSAEIMSIMRGQSVGGRTTLGAELGRGAQAETQAERVERQRLDRERFGLQGEIERGSQALGVGSQELDRQRLKLEQEMGRGRLGLERAELFGGEDSITLGQIGDFGADAIINPDGSLAVDRASFMEASVRIDEGFNQRYGRSPSASEMSRIMQGEEVGGRTTLAASEASADRRLQSEMATGQVTIDGKRQQTLQDFIERGELTNQTSALFADQLGYIRDPVDGSRIKTLSGRASDLQDENFSESTRQFNAEFFGNMIDPETGKVRDGLDSQQVANQIAQFNRQMANSERELTANIGQAWAGITGETGTPSPVNADDFGVDVSAMANVNRMMWRNTDEYKRVSEGVRAMTGQEATDDQIMSILGGGDAMIDGAPTMEARELSTRVVQANMDREVQISQFAKEIGLEREVFNEATEAADREWQVATQDVAAVFGLAEDDWAQARSVYERGLSRGDTPEEASADAARQSGLNPTEFRQANTMFETRWGQQSRAAAFEMGLTEEQWEHTKKAREDMDKRENDYWDGIMGGAGQDVGMGDLLRLLPPNEPDADSSLMINAHVDEILWGALPANSIQNSEGVADRSLISGPQFDGIKAEIRNKILSDPMGFAADLEDIFSGRALDNSSSGKARRLTFQNKGYSAQLIQTFSALRDGVSKQHMVDLSNQVRDQVGFEGYSTSASEVDWSTSSGKQQAFDILSAEYPEMTEAQVAEIIAGKSARVVPDNWMDAFSAEERMEILSLIHGGTSFAIAAKEPSLSQTLGGFAGAAAGQFAGGAGASLFNNLFGPKD